ncbi:type VI secretion system tip protein VgrG [Derxia gummosa]|uniref:Type VI secretion system tip protein VgrG n=1 Tax=Derxia gummosa DSM 723 TaxID=1121388 RepID=A0A8B6X3G5_9BURK|nr:type VI secretion system tip protein VgrG [Derxia gummosa]
MADSPNAGANGVVRVTVKSEGAPVPATAQLMALEITHAINRVPLARLVYLDGDMPNDAFPLSDADSFAPGKAISISLGYGDEETEVFAGIVVRQGITIGDEGPRLIVECRHPVVALTVGRKNASYIDQKDSDVIQQLLGASGASATVSATEVQYGELVQYYCTDWDFAVARAEASGMVVVCTPGKVTVEAPATDGSAVLALDYGNDLREFRADMEARDQFGSVTATAWDPSTLAVASAEAAPEALNAQGDVTSQKLSEVVNLTAFALQSGTALASDALTAWAKGRQLRAGLARIRGRMRFVGSALALPGTLLDVAGVGKHFSGSVYATAVTHRLSGGDWDTEVEFGLDPAHITDRPDVTAPPAAGWLPGVEGLQPGIVSKLDGDPAGGQRIQVTLPLLGSAAQPVWARWVMPYASNAFGAFFVPEVGDEVLVGFFNNDPSHPVVLGSLYGGKNAPAYDLTADNNTKAIVTRSLTRVEIDDEKKSITLVTPAKNQIVISDDAKSITVQDQTGNKLVLSDSGIEMSSPKDIKISATGNLSLSATGKVSIEATQDLSAKGMNATVEAQIGLTAKGAATAELSASGQTTVKGALVMIN